MQRSHQQQPPPPPSPSSSSSSVSADTVLIPPGKRRRAAATAKTTAKTGAKPKRARKDPAAADPPPPATAAAGKRSSVYRGVTRYASLACMPSLPTASIPAARGPRLPPPDPSHPTPAARGSCIAAKFASFFLSTAPHSQPPEFRSISTPAPLCIRCAGGGASPPPPAARLLPPSLLSFLHPAIALERETFGCTHACHIRRRRQSLLVPPLVDRTCRGWRLLCRAPCLRSPSPCRLFRRCCSRRLHFHASLSVSQRTRRSRFLVAIR